MWSPMTDVIGNPIIHNAPGGDIALGFTKVIAFASVNNTTCNPVADLRNLVIDEISISVHRPGNSHKGMTECQWTGPEEMFEIVPE